MNECGQYVAANNELEGHESRWPKVAEEPARTSACARAQVCAHPLNQRVRWRSHGRKRAGASSYVVEAITPQR